MSDYDLARLLVALLSLLVAAHIVGGLFARVRQPRAIGEIVGGLLIGPTVLGHFAPDAESWVFPTAGPVAASLAVMEQLGLLLLMFCAGVELRTLLDRRHDRLVAIVAVTGILLPFLAGGLLLLVFDFRTHHGPSGNALSFGLVLATAVAVTSIPVIARIMHDLGLLGLPFARVVLSVAVVEDIVLYVVLSIAVGAAAGSATVFGLPAVLGLEPGSAPDIVYHTLATLAVLATVLAVAEVLRRRHRVRRGAPGPLPSLLLLLGVTVACLLTGVEPFLGELAVGLAVAAARPGRARSGSPVDPGGGREVIVRFSFAFFIPVYFASVGASLDLTLGFDPWFFLAFSAFACAVKACAVYLGARLARTTKAVALNLAIALNARGGPGIVLATIAYQAQIVDEGFYACLVLLAVVTSLMAGGWLERQPRDVFTERLVPVEPSGEQAR